MAEIKTIEFETSRDGGLYTVRVTISDDYDIASNVSTLRVTQIELKSTSYNGTQASVDGTVLINGQNAATFINQGGWHTLRSYYNGASEPQTQTPISVLHNNDGSLSVNVSLGRNSAAYSAFTVAIQSGGYIYKKMTSTAQTLALTTQARASGIASVTQNAVTLGAIELTMNRKMSGATHIAALTSGAHTLYTSGSFAETLSITAAREWFSHFASAEVITATLSVQTYFDGTAIGDAVTASISITADEGMKPSTSSGWFATTRVNAAAAAGIAAYIKGYSQTRFTFDSSKITMASGASIALYSVSYAGITKTGSGTITTDTLNAAGTVTFTVRVTDSRGRYAESTASITVNDYSPPTLSGASIQRSDSSGVPADAGTYIALKATANVSPINSLNTYTMEASYKAQGGSYGTGATMTSGVLLVIGGGLIAANQSYSARIVLTDALGNTASLEAVIATAEVAFHIRAGGHGAAFGKYAEVDNELQLPADWRIKRGNDYIEPCRAANANLLDNWYFGNPVNQRGQSSYIGTNFTTYSLDRWIIHGTVTVENGYITMSDAGSPYGYGYLAQKFENSLSGITVTASLLTADNQLYSGTVTLGSTAQIISIESRGAYMELGSDHFTLHTGYLDYELRAKAVKLELGTQQTLAHQENGVWVLNEIPSYADELARCKRFYQALPGVIYAMEFSNGNNTYYAPTCRFTPTMRTAPSCAHTGGLRTLFGEGRSDIWQTYSATADRPPVLRCPYGNALYQLENLTATADL